MVDNREELFDIYDENMEHLGIKPRWQVHRDGDWHQTFHCWVIYRGDKDYMVVQRRAATKDTYPNFLDISAAGHYEAGEALESAAVREVQEELGIRVSFNDLVSLNGMRVSICRPSAETVDREFNKVFFLVNNLPLEDYSPNDEVSGLAVFVIDDGIAMCAGERESIEARYLDTNTKASSSIQICLSDFVPTKDAYLYKILVLAKRCLNGEKHLVI